MQKVVLLAEFDRNRDGREVGCRDYSGKAERQRDPQRCDGKKQDSGPPREMNENFLEV